MFQITLSESTVWNPDGGFGFGYFRVQHTGATSWYPMASTRSNPMQHGEL